MMTKDESLKMAKEALESSNDCECGRSEYYVSKLIKAINACKEALEQKEYDEKTTA